MIKKKLLLIYLIICFSAGITNIVYAKADNYINLIEYGAKADGVTNVSGILQNAIDSLKNSKEKATVYIPAGEYYLASSITMKPNITITGEGKASHFIVDDKFSDYVFTGRDADNIVLEKFSVSHIGTISRRCIDFGACDNVRVEGLSITGMGLGQITGTIIETYNYIMAENIHVLNNDICGSDGSAGNYYAASNCIAIRYVNNAVVDGNRVENCGHGITWWGGDSNQTRQGAPENDRACKNLTITNNIVTNVTGGGIWGSMGENIIIANNVVTHAHDVGIDVEGCYYSTIENNVVYECNNGGITTFFYCRGTVVSGNTVYSSMPEQYALKIYNAGQTMKNEDVTVVGNTFVNTSERGGLCGGNNCEKIIYENNNFVNVFIFQAHNNSRYTKISSNHFLIDKKMEQPFNAIAAGNTHFNGSVVIQDNIIESICKQPMGSIAIQVTQSDGSSVSSNIVSGNIVRGFDTEVNTIDRSMNQRHAFIISDNVFDKGAFTNSGDGVLKFNDNYISSGKYAVGDIPTTGYWEQGQIIYFNFPDMEGYAGAVCVEAGEPGVWKYFGKIK